MTRTSLPPGFRFHPTDVELIKFYLKRKVLGKQFRFEAISEIDIYKFAPGDLPDKSCLRSKDLEWYFFCPTERKYTNGARMNRATEYGYWKTTGKDRSILYNEQTVGMIKTLIFHTGRAPRGDRTDWVMHEYRLKDEDLTGAGVVQDAYVLCKIFKKSGLGPKNGAQYGAPFNEEEWSDDEEEVAGVESFPLAGMFAPAPALQNNQDNSAVTSTIIPGTICIGSSSESTPSKTVQSPDNMLRPVQDDDVSMPDIPLLSNDDILSMLDCFTDESEKNENLNNVNHDEIIQTAASDDNDIYNDLPVLGKWPEMSGNGLYFSNDCKTVFANNQMVSCVDGLYLELNDLQSPLGGPSNTYGSERTPIDAEPSHYTFYNSSEQSCYPVNYFDAVHHASAISQSSVLAEGFYGFENQLDVFQDNGVKGDKQGNQEHEATLNNAEVTVWNQPLLGSGYVSQVHERENSREDIIQDPNFC